MDRPLVVLDTETATLGGPPHLLELAALRVVDGEAVDSFESLVSPQVPVEPRATEIHGIVDDDVRDAPEAAEVLERFGTWLGGDWIVAHNARFDARVLAFEHARWRLEPADVPWIDTLPLARRLIPEAPSHALDQLCPFLGLEEGEHHRALADAVWCWKVLEVCAERLASQGGEARAATLLASAGTPISMPGCAPGAGVRLRPRHRLLTSAATEGSEVTLVYGRADEAPVPLSVRPRFLFRQGDRSYLEAECASSGTLKTYRLDRVHRVIAGAGP